MSLSEDLVARLRGAGIDPDELFALVTVALDEDLRYGPDVTTEATVSATVTGVGDVVARQRGVVCGLVVARAVLEMAGVPASSVTVWCEEGDVVDPATVVLTVSATVRQLLLVERTMLNFLTHLSGIATATHQWVLALEGTNCRVRDTRKTLPGLRQLEKYAVRCGGGVNHRMGLGDAALIKDNHVIASGSISTAIERVRSSDSDVALEVECDSLAQVREAVACGSTLILLDNMTIDEMTEAVREVRGTPNVLVEASGGLTLATAGAVAATGVDFLAVGALTHSSAALDLAFDVRPVA